ncbi:hypothetical protein [Streptomyces sp. CBMA152]|uniref:hypothetical protein n=1 Tax=Streptomyces sp. CBMA152 TaxID=1896312 RepID=UPI001CB6EC0C|nr:hypothetical protein [Streptomyces sp. CBMA152]
MRPRMRRKVVTQLVTVTAAALLALCGATAFAATPASAAVAAPTAPTEPGWDATVA